MISKDSPSVPAAVIESAAAIDVEGVRAGYGGGDVLRGVSLRVDQGSVTALLGANGAGKSTLLKTISGLLKPSEGTVRIRGLAVNGQSPEKRASGGLLHITEGRGIYRSLTVRENLIMQCTRGEANTAVERAAEVFPVLGERLKQQAGTLSGGQQQMLALAAAYVRSPQVILVDEPSLGLAPLIVEAVFEYLEKISRSGVALLLVDQFAYRALDMADRAYVMRRGEIVYEGKADELAKGDVFEYYVGADES